jgi:hypothetical protein
MIEFTTFRGDAQEAAEFTQRIWLSRFRGRLTVPVWTAEFLDWQLFSDPSDQPYLVAAYRAGKLVGCVFSRPVRFRLRGVELDGGMSSWLTADPRAGRGVGRGMVLETLKRMQERSCRFMMAFGLQGPRSNGATFLAGFSEHTILGRGNYLWARPIDVAALARDEPSAQARFGAGLLASISRRSPLRDPIPARSPWPGLSRYSAADLDDCLTLMNRATSSVELGYCWQPQQLARQLSYADVPTTLVSRSGASVDGLVNYYPIELQGKGRLRAAFIDHCVTAHGNLRTEVRLLRAALGDLRSRGVQVVLTSRLSGVRRPALALCGFVPVTPPLRQIFFTDGTQDFALHDIRTARVPVI